MSTDYANVIEDSGEVTFNIRDRSSPPAEVCLEPQSLSHPVREQCFHTEEGMSGHHSSRYVPSEDLSLRQKVDGVTEALADMAKALKLLTESQAHKQVATPGSQANFNHNCFPPRMCEDDRAVDEDSTRVNLGYNHSPPQGTGGNHDSNNYADEQFAMNEDPPNIYRGQQRQFGVEPYGYSHKKIQPNRQKVHVKIAPFTGKGDWAVWMARFEAIAQRNGWTSDEKLDQLLPRMEEQAGQFVFTQLPHGTLNNYSELTNELNCRFRVIETPRAYAAKFSRRIQREGETAEEFAADLKRLYDKAHGYRDRKTREEDLVRKFLDGLRDEDVRFEVEYHKEPNDIDEAVYHAVHMIQIRNMSKSDKRHKSSARRAVEQEGADKNNMTRSNGGASKDVCPRQPDKGGEPTIAEVLAAIKLFDARLEKLEQRGSSQQRML